VDVAVAVGLEVGVSVEVGGGRVSVRLPAFNGLMEE
jgi:hypothetical protein